MASLLRCAILVFICGLFTGAAAKTLLLSGGYLSEGNSEVWNKFITLAGGRGVARIGVLSAAADTPIARGRQVVSLLESYGVAEAYWIPIYEDNKDAAYDKEVLENIKRMTGFFFSGGKQQKYIQYLLEKDRQPTPAFKQIYSMYTNGTIVFGTSAGAMVMPKVYTVVDGTSWGALTGGAFPVGDSDENIDSQLVYDDQGGLGLFDRFIVDSHFSERGRQGRLIRLLADTKDMDRGTALGMGIDEDTCIVITNVDEETETGEVVGFAGVTFIDLRESILDRTSFEFRILNVFSHYLTPGDSISLQDLQITPGSMKRNIKGNETKDYASTSGRIFAQAETGEVSEFRKVAESLFNSRFDSVTYGYTLNNDPEFYVIMTEDSRSKGWFEIDGINEHYSYYDLRLEIRATPEDDDI